MQLTPTIAIHMTAALGALVLGPVALWARLGRLQHPALHRTAGMAWVSLMVVAAVSALFIRDRGLLNIAGYTPIHLLVPFTLVQLVRAFRALARGDIAVHRKTMLSTYIGACLVAGAFTLLPGRFLGNLLWSSIGGLPLPHVLESTMLYTLLSQHPEAFGTILRRTPAWVWALLAGLVLLGLTQLRARTLGATRVALVPLGMTAFSAWGMVSAFSGSYLFVQVLSVWIAVAASVAAAFLTGTARGSYDPVRREFSVPGSALPLLLVVGIFLVKWSVGVELAMAPQRVQDAGFVLTVACLYGGFNGLFAGRAARLWKLSMGPSATPAAA